jgi:AbrB family looped-hinge helix DNA binding protein
VPTMSVKLDNKGRLVVPKVVREAFGAQEGDVFYLDDDVFEGLLVFAAATNPLLRLAEEGRAEYNAGLSTSLNDVAAGLGIALDRGVAASSD